MVALAKNWHPSAPTGDLATRQRTLLEDIWRLHVAFKDEQWLWRGHWCSNWDLEAGIISRAPHRADRIPTLISLLTACRKINLSSHDDIELPDLALLARLQHQGAATALLDVTTDPTVALFMACSVPPSGEFGCCLLHQSGAKTPDGLLVAIRKPAETLEPFDPREMSAVMSGIGSVTYYQPPPIDHRLRIQRGSFLLYRVDQREDLGLEITDRLTLKDRFRRDLGRPPALKDVCVFRVQGELKFSLRELLAARAGLSRGIIYPTAFDRPHLEQFAANHGRNSGVPPTVVLEQPSEGMRVGRRKKDSGPTVVSERSEVPRRVRRRVDPKGGTE